jgi:catechol 2,3-dioxygenase-like lactoylglutathione lyase family enzyme
MIDHIGVTFSDLERSKAFYLAALKPLGYVSVMEFEGAVGMGIGDKPDFWLASGTPASTNIHVAFTTGDRKKVDEFHAAALEAGGKDNGAPGPRTQYHPNYYGAFVLDPDGNNVEVVCHMPVEEEGARGEAEELDEKSTKKRKTEDDAAK